MEESPRNRLGKCGFWTKGDKSDKSGDILAAVTRLPLSQRSENVRVSAVYRAQGRCVDVGVLDVR